MTTFIYFIKAAVLIVRGARYHNTGLRGTLAMVAARNCRLHWLRSSLLEG